MMDTSLSTSTLSCPCCAFLSRGDIFLPRIEVKSDTNYVNGVDAISEVDVPSVQEIIASPAEAWDRILKNKPRGKENAFECGRVIMVDTHGHPHLQRETQYADMIDKRTHFGHGLVVSLTCAVSPADWNDALMYSSQSSYILPALGLHPWYLKDIMIPNLDTFESTDDIATFLKWDWLNDLENQLSDHPHLLVGEIGLCKMARFVREFPKEKGGKSAALQLQKLVFRKQFELAAKWSRPVTVHCVNAHGLFMDVMREVLNEAKNSCTENNGLFTMTHWRKAFPPAIAMHSFSGTAHHVREILAFEQHLEEVGAGREKCKRKQKQPVEGAIIAESDIVLSNDNSKGPLFFFGFSHSVNHLMCTSEKARKKGEEALRSVPSDRLLVESDVHASDDVVLGTAGSVAYVAHARGERIEDVAEICARNGLRFLNSLDSIEK
jgi:Tat protein secretion system quality control protein TatD with DNase activity